MNPRTKSASQRKRVILVVNGFPNASHPSRGIFNARAAKALSSVTDLQIVVLRAWKPGRRLISHGQYEGIPTVTVAAPQFVGASRMNAVLFRLLGWPWLRTVFSRCHVAHSVDAWDVGVIVGAWADRARIRHVTQVTSVRPAGALLNGRIDGVACNSRALMTEYLSICPDAINVRTVYRGVDLQQFTPDGPVKDHLLSTAALRFLYLGGFPAYPHLPYRSNTKGGETLLDAWQAGEKELVEAGASLVIAGPESDNKRILDWRRRLQHPNLVYVAGALEPDVVAHYIRAADAVLVPSLQEGLPNVAMEASACARPVIGSDIGGVSDVVEDLVSGFLVPPANAIALKELLIATARQPARLKEMGRWARRRMENMFDANSYPRHMVSLYDAALGEPMNSAKSCGEIRV